MEREPPATKTICIEIACQKAQPDFTPTIIDELEEMLDDFEAELQHFATTFFGRGVKIKLSLRP